MLTLEVKYCKEDTYAMKLLKEARKAWKKDGGVSYSALLSYGDIKKERQREKSSREMSRTHNRNNWRKRVGGEGREV